MQHNPVPAVIHEVFDIFPISVHRFRAKFTLELKNTILNTIARNKHDPNIMDSPRNKINGLYTDYLLGNTWGELVWEPHLGPLLKPFMDHFGVKVSDIWAQEYTNRAGMPHHRHHLQGFSAVFYVQLAEQHCRTGFFRPYMDPNDPNHLLERTEPPVEEGDILIFPSWLAHDVLVQQTDTKISPRTIISFNLVPTTA